MGGLQEKLMEEMKEAMKSGDPLKVSVIRMLRASIKNKEIEKGKGQLLTDVDVMELIMSSIKQHKDSIEQFAKGRRDDLVEKEQKELDLLQKFLPQPLTPQELEQKIREAIQASGAMGIKDMGKVMKIAMPQLVGRAEGSAVSKLVKDLLSQYKLQAHAGFEGALTSIRRTLLCYFRIPEKKEGRFEFIQHSGRNDSNN
jgi:uncharacterized protein YqeY